VEGGRPCQIYAAGCARCAAQCVGPVPLPTNAACRLANCNDRFSARSALARFTGPTVRGLRVESPRIFPPPVEDLAIDLSAAREFCNIEGLPKAAG